MATLPETLGARPLYEEVAERIRLRIVGRQLEPGTWIDELALCRELGISRTPMREALKVLATEGLITIRPRRGAYVTEMSARDVHEAYQLLSLLESDAAAQAAQRATDAEMAALQHIHDRLEAAIEERERFFACNEEFHMKLLEIDGNRWRLQIVLDLRRLMKLNRHHSLLKQGRLQESLQEHRDIMHALQRRDGEAARNLTRRHFDNGLAATDAI